MRLTPPLNLPAPGRRQCVYSALRGLARTCVFAKQSLESILCDQKELRCTLHLFRHPFFRSYGIIMPSSLTRFHSFTLGYSPCPPVSVYGTDVRSTPVRAFLACRLHATRVWVAPRSRTQVSTYVYTLERPSTKPLAFRSWVPAELLTHCRRGRNFDRLSIVYASGAST